MAEVRTGRRRAIPRRALLASGAAVATMAAPGCQLVSTEPSEKGSGGASRGAKEAPGLARLVDQGELPAVKDRLPEKPLVVEATERPGGYGGTLRGTLTLTENAYLYCLVAYDNLVRWTEKWTGAPGTDELVANLAETFTVNEDATRFEFTLRKGLRWSDGKPFTADDVVFAVEDVLLDTELYPVPPSLLTVAEGTATITKGSDYSFTITFPGSAGTFIQEVATWDGRVLTYYPAHYMRKFHKKYNPQVAALAKEQGFSSWIELFQGKAANYGENPDLPGLAAWRLVAPFGEGQHVTLERNPYYWKVDSDGRQLPYVDEVAFDIVNSTETMLLKTLHGDVSLEAGPDQRITGPANKPLFARNRDSGDYRLIAAQPERMNVMTMFVNLTHEDPVKRQIFRDKRFRMGLSHAIDRPEIIKATMQRQGAPFQVAPLPTSAYYNEEFATQFLEYDVDRANALLDEVVPARSSGGTRLGPDDRPVSIRIEYAASFREVWTDILELVKGYWTEVGIDVQLRNEDLALLGQRRDANKFDATVWQGDGGIAVLLSAGNYLPLGTGSRIAPLWGQWQETGGAEGEEPPEATKRQLRLYDEVKSTGDPDRQQQLMGELLDIAREQFYAIGIARETDAYLVAKNDLRNVPETMIQGFVYPTPGPTRPEQYFFA